MKDVDLRFVTILLVVVGFSLAKAAEIPMNCRAVVNVLEVQQDGSKRSVDREVSHFEASYVDGETIFNGIALRDRVFTVTTTCLSLRFNEDGSPVLSPGVILNISKENDLKLVGEAESWSTIAGRFGYVMKLEGLPLPEGRPGDRTTIWALRCYWSQDTSYQCH